MNNEELIVVRPRPSIRAVDTAPVWVVIVVPPAGGKKRLASSRKARAIAGALASATGKPTLIMTDERDPYSRLAAEELARSVGPNWRQTLADPAIENDLQTRIEEMLQASCTRSIETATNETNRIWFTGNPMAPRSLLGEWSVSRPFASLVGYFMPPIEEHTQAMSDRLLTPMTAEESEKSTGRRVACDGVPLAQLRNYYLLEFQSSSNITGSQWGREWPLTLSAGLRAVNRVLWGNEDPLFSTIASSIAQAKFSNRILDASVLSLNDGGTQ